MWSLFASEDIPAGAFIVEYCGEIVSKKQGDMRGSYYDSVGLSYLFDMNDPDEEDEFELRIQDGYNNEFFPLCIDSMFYGNEARFINHSCESNVTSFNLSGNVESQCLHKIGLFASRKILKGEELTIDYQWDKNELAIPESIPCLCESLRCRNFLMRARKKKV
jgi:histone-lysine N-methyltransferase SUV39H